MKRRHFLAAASLPLLGCNPPQEAVLGGFVGISHERGHLLRHAVGGKVGAAVGAASGKTRRTRVLIVGGGVAGLAAARALRLSGMHDFALLELEDAAGGNSRGGQMQGLACPLGAHYLPVPGPHAYDVQDFLEELGLRQRAAGRWVYDERHLCHSPQERLFIHGQWQEGLLPLQGMDAATLAEYWRFSAKVQELAQQAPFKIPSRNTPLSPLQKGLDAITFEAWLNREQFSSPYLRWFLDYCCRDDYGAGPAAVSAWAGLHYFASRHGFQAPGTEPEGERDGGILTWPQGNGWLTQRLANPLGERLHTGHVVLRIAALKHGVQVDAWNAATQAVERWQAEQCIVALPLMVAARVLENPPAALRQAAALLRYAPWLVANVHLKHPLFDQPGAAPSWDNVVYSPLPSGQGGPLLPPGLGYVNATHQSLQAVPGATVLTYYRAFGLAPAVRQQLYQQPWAHWRDAVLAELAQPHPDLPGKATQIDVVRYGHAMSSPVPGVRSSPALLALQQTQAAPWNNLYFAHSDLSAYSIFEEAFTHGHAAGMAVVKSLG